MPQDIYGLPVPIPSLWDWNWGLVGLMAAVIVVGLPLLATVSDRVFDRGEFLRALPRDLFLVGAVTALAIVAQYADPPEGAWYTTVWWHAVLLVAGIVVMLRLRKVGLSEGRVLVRGEPNDTELMRTLVYGWILSWVVAALPAIFTLPAWGVLFSLVLLAAFFVFPWVYPLIAVWADGMPEIEERVERRIEQRWGARSGP
ncbi:MAG: hypothetical protein ACR2GL_09005 [Thermoleophilaceae bacterium]